MEKMLRFFKRNRIASRVICGVLAMAMVLTMGSFQNWGQTVAKADEPATKKVVIHFKNEKNWSLVNMKIGSGDSWNSISGYENYKTNDTGSKIDANVANAGWYSKELVIDSSISKLCGLFNCNEWGDEKQTANFAITLSGTSNQEVWITYDDVATGNAISVSTTVPEGWKNELLIHFKNEKEWSKVNIKFGAGDSWDAVTGYEEYKTAEYGQEISANASDSSMYDMAIALPTTVTKICGLFNNGSWAGDNQTSNFGITVNGYTEVWIVYTSGNTIAEKYIDPAMETAPSFTDATITMHFKKPATGWDVVYTKIATGSSWDAISGYAYANGWPGAEVEADPNNAGWYSFKITMPVSEFHCIFNNNNNGIQTDNINFTPTSENTEKWVEFTTHLGDPTISDTAPAGWVTGATYNAPIDPNAALGLVSPEVDNGTVTFRYAGTVSESVHVCGNFNGWGDAIGDSNYAFTQDAGTGVWELSLSMTPGIYQYKFVVDGSNWVVDSLNSKSADGNSLLVVPGLASKSVSATVGVATDLPATLDLYSATGSKSSVAVSYTVPSAVSSYVTIADGKITVDESFTGESIALTAKDSNDNEAVVTVNVVQHLYEYTIYYYDWNDAHRTTSAADLWMWEVNGAAGSAIEFTSVETLADGRDWLKTVVSVPYTNLGLLPRSYGAWSWKGGECTYNNTAMSDSTTLYLVSNSTKASTSLPELVEPRERNVVVEYTRSAKDYEGWNIYSWNTGLADSTEIYGDEEVIDGVSYMTIPVTDSSVDLNLAFCMRLTTEDNDWEAKDGGDHYILVPADQTAVKAKFVQGSGVTEILPYNKGYEMDAANDMIHFYYRDDVLFVANQEEELVGKVKVVVDGQEHAMAYDAANERYYYDAVGLATGDHEYSYVVDGVSVLDAFNSKKNAAKTASVLTYKKFTNLGIKATAYYTSMTYNDNNVISVAFDGADAANITNAEVSEVTVDCSALGTGSLSISPELMEGTIACKFGTTGGAKSLPVKVKDIYGNVYTTTVEVTVAARTKTANDFDWDEAVVYFAVTDRFFDGSTANNAGVDKDGSLSYHGGDFAGLQAKLDYLQDLGVNTIWITPIVENTDVTTDKDGQTIESTGYHGYWAGDFTKLNSHLGTEEEFAALIEAAHARGMKLMVDVVINHAGYGDTSNFVVVNEETGETIQMVRNEDNTISGSDVYSSLAGLPDFVTENEYVRNQLVEWQVDWIKKYDIDYYRVDTVKHVDTVTWQAFKNELTKANQDFKLIGEESGSGYASNSKNLGNGAMDALLDFDFNDFAVGFVSGSISNTESSLVARNAAIDNTKTLGSFINSHDEDGLQDKLQTQKEMTAEETLNLMKVAASLSITAKGIPVIYYGEELGLYGKDNYPYQTNRYDMDWELAAKQMANTNSIYNHYKTMLAIRKDYTDVFARGTRTTVEASDEKGYDIFARSYDGKKLYVGINIKDAQTVAIPVTEAAGTVLTDLYSGDTYIVDKNQKVKVTLPAAVDGGTVVLTADKEVCLTIPVSGTDFTEVIDTINAVADGTKIVVIPADTTVIPKTVFEALKGRDIDVEFQFAASPKNGNMAYTWCVNGKDITDVIGNIDLGITFGTKNIPMKLINALVGSKAYVQLSINHNGSFGCAMYLNIQFASKYGSKYGNLYYHNVAGEKLDYMQSVKGSSHGLFKGFKFMHASDYVIVLSDEAMDANSASAPKTGDRFPIAPVAVLFVGSACVAFAVKRRKAK